MIQCIYCKKVTETYYKGFCASCLDKAILLLPTVIKTKVGRKPYLWESMCAVYPTKEKVLIFHNSTELLTDYIKRQAKKEKRLKYVVYCKTHYKEACECAARLMMKRIEGNDFDMDYIDLKD